MNRASAGGSLCLSLSPWPNHRPCTRPETGRRLETVDSGFDVALLSASCSPNQRDVDRHKVRLYLLLSKRKRERTKGLHLSPVLTPAQPRSTGASEHVPN